MKNEEIYMLEKFGKALEKLEEGVAKAQEELEKDGVIQRFEFTFEILWKTLKFFLQEQGIIARTPRESLQEAFRLGWLKEEAVVLEMLDDRNKTSHIYNRETAEAIFRRISKKYTTTIKQIHHTIKVLHDKE